MSDNEKAAREPYTIWSMPTTFRRDGSPVMGSFGASVQQVVVMTSETFKRLVRENPDLSTAQFNVGTFD
jgi:hypothetical protein